ncbi:lasso peptide biosynthesis B2 protein [Shimazuella sp. AN120528]|uniref:lasso peptide biosynthesis B2 protein n=1 Tax=Shimazuella soli TaxID=1892854 RepID=UPI001F101575|nr:lasso peptide biosynthesis B2 protein [Shimazuella soli]MCH5583672.1 lasso peptide biosynthesis B2 protein [Shimazuella soli]
MKDMYTFMITGERGFPNIKIPMSFLLQSPFLVFNLLRRYKQLEGNKKLHMLENIKTDCSIDLHNERMRYLFARKIAGLTILWINLFRQGEALCLERAIIICMVLRSFGLSAKVIIGKKLSFSMIERFPFHAWVELDGKPVDEHIGVLDQYKRLDEIPS